jgi:uncharacterized protein (DUF2236 family)
MQEPSPWSLELEQGTDAGYFSQDGAVWAVNGSLSTLVAGIRALLIQTLHPGAMAGVHDHSHYREDPTGRLENTIRWVATTTFGDRAAAQGAARFVGRLHDHVNGTYLDAAERSREYSARDPELLRWVHDAFALAFIGAHETFGGPIPGGADRYVAEWAISGELLGLTDPPRSRAELDAQLAAFTADLKPDERVRDTVRFLRRPPLEPAVQRVYPILFAAAAASLPVEYRRLLGLRRPWWPAITLGRIFLRLAGWALGTPSPSEKAARRRLARLAAESAPADTAEAKRAESMP